MLFKKIDSIALTEGIIFCSMADVHTKAMGSYPIAIGMSGIKTGIQCLEAGEKIFKCQWISFKLHD